MGETATVNSAYIKGTEVMPVKITARLTDGSARVHIPAVDDWTNPQLCKHVRGAVAAAGFDMPRCAVEVEIEGAHRCLANEAADLELAVAVAVLCASGQIPKDCMDDTMFYGALDDGDGRVLPRRGAVAVQLYAEANGMKPVFSPTVDVIDGTPCFAMGGLRDAVNLPSLPQITPVSPAAIPAADPCDKIACGLLDSLRDAVEGGQGIAVVGGTDDEREDIVAAVRSVMGEIPASDRRERAAIASILTQDVSLALGGDRPVVRYGGGRSIADLIGGGRPVMPGRVSQADGGVLAYDMAANVEGRDFAPEPELVAKMLRSPALYGEVHLVMADEEHFFPSHFQPVLFFPDTAVGREAREEFRKIAPVDIDPSAIHDGGWEEVHEPILPDRADIMPDEQMRD